MGVIQEQNEINKEHNKCCAALSETDHIKGGSLQFKVFTSSFTKMNANSVITAYKEIFITTSLLLYCPLMRC